MIRSVFDTSSLIVLEHYFPETFPSFWERFDALVAEGIVVSTREVRRELDAFTNRPHILEWAKRNPGFFPVPTPSEQLFVSEILSLPRFQALIKARSLQLGLPVADPFVISAARALNAEVVTQESYKKGAARIPNACEYYGIPCQTLEAFLRRTGWMF